MFLLPEAAPIELLPFGGSALLHSQVIDPLRASTLFDALLGSLAWQDHQVFVYGRWVTQPRLTAWYGDPGTSYKYSGIELKPTPWTEELREIRAVCERLAGASFNSVLANLYRDGADGVSWHADDERELGRNPIIASVSLGEERRFDMRHKGTGVTLNTLLPSGSVLVMSGQTQHEWIHQIPKTTRKISARINLTFRQING